jgi:hypothetical protein
MRPNSTFSRALVFILLSSPSSMFAANATGVPSGAPAPEVPVMSGGIGPATRQALADAARDYNLKLVFTLASGNYLSDVPFQITNPAGRLLLRHIPAGPIAYVKLPPGTYRITAALGEQKQSKFASVGHTRQQTVYFRWQREALE